MGELLKNEKIKIIEKLLFKDTHGNGQQGEDWLGGVGGESNGEKNLYNCNWTTIKKYSLYDSGYIK